MNETTAARYQRLRRRVRVAGLLSAAVVLSIVALTPLSHAAADRLVAAVSSRTVAAALFALALVLLLELAALPAVLYFDSRGVGRTRRTRAAAGEVLAAHGQATLVVVGVALAGSIIWSFSVWAGGDLWWALAAALAAAALVAGLRAAPAIFARLGDVRDVSRPGLTTKLAEVARASRVRVGGVHEWRVADEANASALVTGAGTSRRILIASPLLRDWSDDEIAVVVAHELAHHRHHDLHVALLVDALVVAVAGWSAHASLVRTQASLGLSGPADLAALPFLLLIAGLVWIVATPVRHALSRWQERRADAFALKITGGAAAFSTAIRRLGARHLAEERPSRLTRWLFQRHPTVAERLEMASRWTRTLNGQ